MERRHKAECKEGVKAECKEDPWLDRTEKLAEDSVGRQNGELALSMEIGVVDKNTGNEMRCCSIDFSNKEKRGHCRKHSYNDILGYMYIHTY
jgi:hypothetical protein